MEEDTLCCALYKMYTLCTLFQNVSMFLDITLIDLGNKLCDGCQCVFSINDSLSCISIMSHHLLGLREMKNKYLTQITKYLLQAVVSFAKGVCICFRLLKWLWYIYIASKIDLCICTSLNVPLAHRMTRGISIAVHNRGECMLQYGHS